MTLVSPPGWLQNVGAINTAQHLRNYEFAALPGVGGSISPAGGVNFSRGGQLRVIPTNPFSMNVQVQSGVGVIPGTEANLQGGYAFVNDSTVVLPVDAADPSEDRVDLVVARIRDSQYSGGTDNVTLEIVKGTPATTPVFATLPPNCLPLAGIYVGVGHTDIWDIDIVDRRWPLDGTLTVRKFADQTVNSSTTFVEDTHLRLPLNLIGGHYAIDGFLFYDSSTVADIKLYLESPTNWETRYSILGPVTSLSGSSSAGEFEAGFDSTVIELGGDLGYWLCARIMGICRPPSSLMVATQFDHFGELKLWWAQNTANASNTRITINSWLRAQQIPF